MKETAIIETLINNNADINIVTTKVIQIIIVGVSLQFMQEKQRSPKHYSIVVLI